MPVAAFLQNVKSMKEFPDITENQGINSEYYNQLNFNFSFPCLSDDFSQCRLINDLTIINYYWWMVVAGEVNEPMKKKVLAYLDGMEQKLNKNEQSSGYRIMMLYKLRFRLLYKDNFHVFKLLSEFNGIVEHGRQGSDCGMKDYTRLIGNLIDYLTLVLYEKYPFFSSMFINKEKPNKTVIIKEIQALTISDNLIIRTESNYWLMKLYLENELDYIAAEKYALHLVKDYPFNYIFSYYYASVLLKNKNFLLASEEIKRAMSFLDMNESLTQAQKAHGLSLFYSLKGLSQ
jgi:hypothetical protein